ncbi:nuclease PIN [Escherichia coli]|nr:nuclease PIN [Escherichia coli]EGB0884991.1 nuclease PIN [Escherichia coli]EGB0937029.1 nuclease PIN [Escherichia coli]EGF1582114.1 nuclease PIN [Escherichia coli]EGF1717750.1 nuclease PIN [Escherichia coli]
MRFFVVFVLSFFTCFKSMAVERYCNLLWANNTKPSVLPFKLNVDGNVSLNTPITINVGGQSTAIVRSADYQESGDPIEGHYRYWFQYPTEWQVTSDGLRYRISSSYDASLVQTPGVKTVVTPLINYVWPDGLAECASLGSWWSFNHAEYSGFLLEIDRATAFPGVYNIQLPVKSGYEENKGSYDGPAGTGGWRDYADALKRFDNIDSSGLQIEIRSACDISAKDIFINYGDININNALSGVRKKVTFNVFCSAPAKVRLEILGGSVDGNKNKINCGDGVCTLMFSSGSADENLTFHSQGRKTVEIESLFKTNEVTAGEFSGSAILRMNVL